MKTITSLMAALSFSLAPALQAQDSKPIPHELISEVGDRHQSGTGTVISFIRVGNQHQWQHSPGHVALLESIRDYLKQLTVVRKTAEKDPSGTRLNQEITKLKKYHKRSEQLLTYIKLPTSTESLIKAWLRESKDTFSDEMKAYDKRLIAWHKRQIDKEHLEIARQNQRELAQTQAQIRAQLAFAERERQRLAQELANERNKPCVYPQHHYHRPHRTYPAKPCPTNTVNRPGSHRKPY